MKPSGTEIVVIALLLGFGVLLAHGWPDGGNIWPALSAISTFVASLVALYFGLRDQRRVSSEIRNRSILEASAAIPCVKQCIKRVEDAARWLRVCGLPDATQAICYSACSASVSSALALMNAIEIRSLVHFDPSVATRIATLTGALLAINNDIEANVGIKNWDTPVFESRFNSWESDLSAISAELRVISQDIERLIERSS
ncbi:hypothetical protein [Orrella marina]|nr:hypothetical protein [Orrella marina]